MKKLLSLMDEKTKRLFMIFGIAVGVFAVIMVVIAIIKGVAGTKVSNDRLLEIMVISSEKYFKDNEKLPTLGSSSVVSVNTLVSEKYMKAIEKYTKDTNCTGTVKVMNNGGLYHYIPSLTCSTYKSSKISSEITKNVVTSGNGLYQVGSEYVFRGEFVNNYISIDNVLWRILGVDASGNLKLIKSSVEPLRRQWDDRYNDELKQASGINDYTVSRMRDIMNGFYNDEEVITLPTKKAIMNTDWCIGRRVNTDNTITHNCDVKMADFLGMITPTEYVMASLDKNCTTIDSKSCANYNYLSKTANSSWTMIATSSNTYEVYAISNQVPTLDRTLRLNSVLLSVTISGENVYLSGDGTLEEPYMMK